MEQKQIFNISDFQELLVIPEEEKKTIMASFKQQAEDEGIDINKSLLDEHEILQLFKMELGALRDHLKSYVEEQLITMQAESARGLSKRDFHAEQTQLMNAVNFIAKFVIKYKQLNETTDRKRKEPEQSSNRYSFNSNNSNKKTKENHKNENSSQNNLSDEEKKKILNDLKNNMGEDIFNDVLIVYNAFKYKHEILFNILQKDLETALEALNEQLLTDIEVTMDELKPENTLQKNTQELHKASAILSNVAKGYDILTSYVEKYIAEHQPSPPSTPSPSPTPYQE